VPNRSRLAIQHLFPPITTTIAPAAARALITGRRQPASASGRDHRNGRCWCWPARRPGPPFRPAPL